LRAKAGGETESNEVFTGYQPQYPD
jgi:hypothetical protein